MKSYVKLQIYSLHKMMFLFSVRVTVCYNMKNWHSEYLLHTAKLCLVT